MQDICGVHPQPVFAVLYYVVPGCCKLLTGCCYRTLPCLADALPSRLQDQIPPEQRGRDRYRGGSSSYRGYGCVPACAACQLTDTRRAVHVCCSSLTALAPPCMCLVELCPVKLQVVWHKPAYKAL